jgi:hypothetical protein
VLAQLAAGQTPNNVFFSTSNNLQVLNFTSGRFTLGWEDQPNGGDGVFNDVVLNVETVGDRVRLGTELQGRSQGEVVDLRDLTGQVSANCTVNREADFNNVIGLYVVQNEQGAVLDPLTGQLVNPGDAGYARIAIQQRLDVAFSVEDGGTATFVNQLNAGAILAPFLIANASVDEFLAANPDNLAGQASQAYFAFLGANSDGVDHVSLLGDNTFGFEDLPGAGDRDYNDLTLKIDLALA